MFSGKQSVFNSFGVFLFRVKRLIMMVKQLIYDSCMIVKKETIISIYHDIQVVHKKHDGMIVVFQIFLLLAYLCTFLATFH